MDKYTSVVLDTVLMVRNAPVRSLAFSDKIGDSRKGAVKLDANVWARTDRDEHATDQEMVGWRLMVLANNGFIL